MVAVGPCTQAVSPAVLALTVAVPKAEKKLHQTISLLSVTFYCTLSPGYVQTSPLHSFPWLRSYVTTTLLPPVTLI
jgi:hypothetical protein